MELKRLVDEGTLEPTQLQSGHQQRKVIKFVLVPNTKGEGSLRETCWGGGGGGSYFTKLGLSQD